MEHTSTYETGDWLVHSHYGVGEIKSIDEMVISGEESRYYRVETADSTFWLPVDKLDSDLLRPLCEPEALKQAIRILRKPPEEMSSNYIMRQRRIERVRSHNMPSAIARLIRDLRARRRDKGTLNNTELSAYHDCKKRLVREWSIVTGEAVENVASRLEQVLAPDPT